MMREQVTFVDEARATPAARGLAAAASRTLVTDVYHGEAPAPAPLVVFAHGMNGHPRKFTKLLSAWATAGYTVAAPAFPLTRDDLPGEAYRPDAAAQPGDLQFVLDRMLHTYGDRVDPGRIAAAGFSLGGRAVYALIAGPARDARIRSAIVIASRPDGSEDALRAGAPPLLVGHGARDPVVPYENALTAYRLARAPKALLTVHVPGHHEFVEDEPQTPADDVVPRATTAFLDLTLNGDADARARLLGAAAPPFADVQTDGL